MLDALLLLGGDFVYYSLTIANNNEYADGILNTYDTWHLFPSERPSFKPPKFKMSTIDIPGRNGLLDVSTSLTKVPTYGNRTGSFEFIIDPESPYTWSDTYSKVANCIHGQEKLVSLEDDSAYWYEGRLWVNDFLSDKKWSSITINYSMVPYKKSKWTTIDEWQVDPFDLDVPISTFFKDLVVDSDDWTDILNTRTMMERRYRQEMVGQGAVVPTVIVNSNDGNGLDISSHNLELDKLYTGHLPDGRNKVNDIIFSMFNPDNIIRFSAKGHGTVSIEYNVRSL